MINNFLRTYFRNLVRNPAYSFINIIGLSIGIAGFVLIIQFVRFEFSFDKFHSNYNQIYRVEQDFGGRGQMIAIVPAALGRAMKKSHPEVIEQTTFGTMPPNTMLAYNENQKMTVENGFMAEPDFFNVFDFKFIDGNAESLAEPFCIILSEHLAKNIFKEEDPMGKLIRWDDRFSYKVTGIVEDCPGNSSITYNFFLSYVSQEHEELRGADFFQSWGAINSLTYLVLAKGVNVDTLNSKVRDIFRREINESYPSHVYVKPMSIMHFHSNVLGELGARGDINKVNILLAIGLFILLIACANFMNLSTARAAKRAKEVGIKKVVGVNKAYLVNQFLAESLLTTFISLFVSILLIELTLDEFNELVQREISIAYFKDFLIIPALFLITITTAIIAGLYPSFILSSYTPIKALKGKISSYKKSTVNFRNILVVFQFTISVVLIISTIIIFRQTNYMKNKDLGFDKDKVVNLNFIAHDSQTLQKYKNLKTDLFQSPLIKDISISNYVPGFNGTSFATGWEGCEEGENVHVWTNLIDLNYFDMYGIEIIEGRKFEAADYIDTVRYCLINETAFKHFGWETVLNKTIRGGTIHVVGLMKDFHFESIQEKIKPLVYFPIVENSPRIIGRNFNFSVQLASVGNKKAISLIEEKYKAHFPNNIFDHRYFKEQYEQAYRSEEKTTKTTAYFSILAIFIACLGLLGLASFIAESKTKEIGIRKVYGASTKEIIFQLSKMFGKWMIIANVIGGPIAYIVMSRWLEDFPYHTNISLFVFIATLIFSVILALITVLYQAIKMAATNPITALRYE